MIRGIGIVINDTPNIYKSMTRRLNTTRYIYLKKKSGYRYPYGKYSHISQHKIQV